VSTRLCRESKSEADEKEHVRLLFVVRQRNWPKSAEYANFEVSVEFFPGEEARELTMLSHRITPTSKFVQNI